MTPAAEKPTYRQGDRVLAEHSILGNLVGVYVGWGIQDDGTRYAALIDSDGHRHDIPVIHPNGQESAFQFHLLG